MHKIDDLLKDTQVPQSYIDGLWCVARPENFKRKHTTFIFRLREALNVLTGKAETLYYYKQ
jgi:hypothetical protein